MEPSAIPNLDLIRKLLDEARNDPQFMDMLRLRMFQGSGQGLDSVASRLGDR